MLRLFTNVPIVLQQQSILQLDVVDLQARLPGKDVAGLVRVLLVAVLRPDPLVQLAVVGGALHAPGPRRQH